jgi:sulfofructose kinase
MVIAMQQFDVIGIGVNAVDALFCLPENFQVDHKNHTTDAKIQAGGPAGTGSCVCAMLGWKTGFITPMGDNMLSQIAKTEYESRGISADLFIPYEQASPVFSIIQIDPRLATRTIFSQMEGYHRVDPADMSVDAVRQTQVLIADCYEPEATMTALEVVQGGPCRSVLDLETGEPEWLWRAITLGTDIIMPLVATRELTGAETPEDAIRKLSENTNAQIVVTDGTQGSWALTPDGLHHQPAFQVKAIDTTGCGDVFHGAYAAGILEGMSLEMRLELAAWMASITATKVGGREALLSRQEIPKQDLSSLSDGLRKKLYEMAS